MDDRIPERGPNGGSYPGYRHFNDGEIPEFTPDARRKRNVAALLISLVCLLAAAALAVYLMESAGKRAASAVRSNSTVLAPALIPQYESSDDAAPFLGMQMGFCGVDVNDSGAMKVCAYRAQRSRKCGDITLPAGHEFVIVSVRATIVEGSMGTTPKSWQFTPTGGRTAELSWVDCSKITEVTMWPTQHGVTAGRAVTGFLAYSVATGQGGQLAYAPDLQRVTASWNLPSQ